MEGAVLQSPGASYVYTPLRPLRREIRLVELLPGNLDDSISCNLRTVSLDDSPNYEALSYVWGDPQCVHRIHLHGFSFYVTINLAAALRRLRKAKESRTLWVDAICINQSDIVERSQEVGLMGSIYQEQRVIVWLGDSTASLQGIQSASPSELTQSTEYPSIDEAEGAFSLLQRISVSQHIHDLPWIDSMDPSGPKIPDEYLKAWQSICEIMCLPYWNRMWTLQETVLPSQGEVVYGPVSMELKSLFGIVHKLFRNKNDCCDMIIHALSRKHYNLIFKACMPLWTIQETISAHNTSSTRGTNTASLLNSNRFREARDPRDKIYGLIGLMKDEIVPVDYSQATQAVYREFTSSHIKQFDTLKMLLFAGEEGRNPDLPSWVPDWSLRSTSRRQSTIVPMRTRTHSIFKASGNTDAITKFYYDQILFTEGLPVDVIEHLSDHHVTYRVTSVDDIHQVVKEWFNFAAIPSSSLDHAYIGGGTVRSAFYQVVLCGGKGFSLREFSPSDLEETFFKWLGKRENLPSSSVRAIERGLSSAIIGRRFFRSKEGYIGLGPVGTKRGDEVAILLGAPAPFILRPASSTPNTAARDDSLSTQFPQTSGCHNLIGYCYLHGVMNGEAMLKKPSELRSFLLS